MTPSSDAPAAIPDIIDLRDSAVEFSDAEIVDGYCNDPSPEWQALMDRVVEMSMDEAYTIDGVLYLP